MSILNISSLSKVRCLKIEPSNAVLSQSSAVARYYHEKFKKATVNFNSKSNAMIDFKHSYALNKSLEILRKVESFISNVAYFWYSKPDFVLLGFASSE